VTDTALAAPPSPYKGLAAFADSELDALFFFGREREIEIIAANLVAARLTVLYGPSGVGKTSLLRAGVANRLRSEGAAIAVVSTWSGDPVSGLLSAVEREVRRVAPGVEGPPPGSVADILAGWSRRLRADLYLVLDQFEEYFLYHGAEADAGPLAALADAIGEPGTRVHVVLSVREDALAQLDAFKSQLPGLFSNSLRLDRLDRRAATRAVEGPLERYNELVAADDAVEIEAELVEDILRSVEAGRIRLGDTGLGGVEEVSTERDSVEAPYLQLVLERLWEVEMERGSKTLRLATLHDLGGASRIVEDHLERAMAALSPREKDAAAAMYNHLVTPSGTKIAHRAGDLARYASVDEREAQRVLERLATERIVRTGENGGPTGRQYEIFHDVLADAVLAWRNRHEADRRLEDERRHVARRHRQALWLALASGIALTIVAVATVYAVTQRSSAKDNARVARAHDLTALAEATLATSPERSLRLALQAARIARTPTVEDALRRALRTLRTAAVFQPGSSVTDVAYSPDGTSLAAVAADEVWLYQTSAPYRGRRLRHPAAVNAAFSTDGRRLVTSGEDGWMRIWDAKAGRLHARVRNVSPGVLSGRALVLAAVRAEKAARGARAFFRILRHATTGADFNQDATLLVTTSNARIARVFDVRTGRIIARLRHRGRIVAARFGPRADIVATAGADKVARLWDARSGHLRAQLEGHTRGLLWVAFSRDGKLVATTSTDATARVWRVADGTLVAVLPGHTNFVRRADFSPDASLIVTGGRDRVARVFDADSATLRGMLAGHTEPITDVAFSPEGTAVATASADGTVRIWDARPFPELRRVKGLQGSVTDLAFTRAGRLVATANGEVLSGDGRRSASVTAGRIETRDVASGRLAATVDAGAGATALALSADGSWLASGDRDGTVRLWRIGDRGAEIEETRRRPYLKPITAVAVSRDGRRFLGAGSGAVTQVWSSSRRTERTLRPRRASLTRASGFSSGALTSAAFSPDGRFVITTDANHDARLWDLTTGGQVWMLSQTALVSDAAFSADGRWLAIAGPGYGGIVDAKTGERILLLDGKDTVLTSVAFSPTRYRIATGGKSGAIRTYDCLLCGGIDELLKLGEQRLARIYATTP